MKRTSRQTRNSQPSGRAIRWDVLDTSSQGEVNAELPERFRGPVRRDHAVAMPDRRHGIRSNPAIAAYYRDQSTTVAEEWMTRPEVPTIKELLEAGCYDPSTHEENRSPFISRFEINADHDSIPFKGSFESARDYLRRMYRLLRADALLPFADALKAFQADPSICENDQDNLTLGIYDDVRVVGVTFANRGLGVRVQFSLRRVGKQIPWRQTKRLTAGSLVVLCNKADPMMRKVAIVGARPQFLLQKDPPEVDLFFATAEDLCLDPETHWVMIEERSTYFEAQRHVLTSLQHMTYETFPLHEHIVHLQPDIPVANSIIASPHMNLSSIFGNTNQTDLGGIKTPSCAANFENIDIIQNWPQNPPTTLDSSQREALHRAFTKRICLIQGPPGCGKTHVSLEAMKALLANMSPGDPPIVVACQTNHALDQFLRLIATFEKSFVRLGSRSKDEGVVKQRTLFEIRANSREKAKTYMQVPSLVASRRRIASLSRDLAKILEPLVDGSQAPNASLLVKHGILTENQAKSIEDQKNWAMPGLEDSNTWKVWVGKDLRCKTIHLKTESLLFPTWEEADPDMEMEMEDVDEENAEKMTAEEEDEFEMLRGPRIEFGPIWWADGPEYPASDLETTLRNTTDLLKVNKGKRPAIFRFLMSKLKRKVLEHFVEASVPFFDEMKNYRIAKMEQDELILREQKIVGLTTTRLSRDRALISSLKPRIVLIEEAGETVEASISTACMESLQQLILVGDHQQLRPHTVNDSLAGEPWNLGISMFERLVNNGLEYSFLSSQRRMKPGISRLLRPIYGDRLKDHPSVMARAKVEGMGPVSTWFLHHTKPESFDVNHSALNQHEAHMIVGLVAYLMANGVHASQITILTFYNGQRKLILKLMQRKPTLKPHLRDLHIATVDSYQGEENGVILLSLVRSNYEGKIGFLAVINRICVALSRAQRGLYIFGNSKLLSRNSHIWDAVLDIIRGDPSGPAKIPSRHGLAIPITCQNHRRRLEISEPSQWEDNHGGCDLKCDGQLPCGHACALKCHPSSHDGVICWQICQKSLSCGHRCDGPCNAPCHCKVCGISDAEVVKTTSVNPKTIAIPKPVQSSEAASSVITRLGSRGATEHIVVRSNQDTPAQAQLQGKARKDVHTDTTKWSDGRTYAQVSRHGNTSQRDLRTHQQDDWRAAFGRLNEEKCPRSDDSSKATKTTFNVTDWSKLAREAQAEEVQAQSSVLLDTDYDLANRVLIEDDGNPTPNVPPSIDTTSIREDKVPHQRAQSRGTSMKRTWVVSVPEGHDQAPSYSKVSSNNPGTSIANGTAADTQHTNTNVGQIVGRNLLTPEKILMNKRFAAPAEPAAPERRNIEIIGNENESGSAKKVEQVQDALDLKPWTAAASNSSNSPSDVAVKTSNSLVDVSTEAEPVDRWCDSSSAEEPYNPYQDELLGLDWK